MKHIHTPQRRVQENRSMYNENVSRLLTVLLGEEKTRVLLSTLNFPSILNDWEEGTVTRAELA